MSGWVVLDTSVLFKWFVAYGETGLDEAWRLRREHQEGRVIIATPTSAGIELANILSYSGIDAGDAQALLAEFERAHIQTFGSTPDRVARALECAYTHRMSVYDALFLVLAQELDCTLVTADRRAFGSVPRAVADIRLVL